MAEQHEEQSEHVVKGFSLAGSIGHTHVNSVVNSGGDKEWLLLPSFGLNLNYRFNEKWGIGLHKDIIIEEFEVEDPNADDHLEAKK